MKEEDPDTLIVAAEPLQGELVQGLRSLEDGFIPPIIDLEMLDRKIFVSNRDSVVWTKKLLAEEGLFVGVSSGAIASIAVRVAEGLDEGNVVFVVCDDGWKYLSSGRLHQAHRGAGGRRSRQPASGSRLGRRGDLGLVLAFWTAAVVLWTAVLLDRGASSSSSSSASSSSSKLTPDMALRISRMPLPTERAASGQLLRAREPAGR